MTTIAAPPRVMSWPARSEGSIVAVALGARVGKGEEVAPSVGVLACPGVRASVAVATGTEAEAADVVRDAGAAAEPVGLEVAVATMVSEAAERVGR